MDRTELLNILKNWKEDIKDDIKKAIREDIEILQNNIFSVIDQKIELLEKKINYLESESKARNVILHGLEEDEEHSMGLEEKVVTILKNKINNDINIEHFNFIRRIGRPSENKTRPVLISMLALRIKNVILKNKNNLKSTKYYITEDFPKDIQLKRKELIPKLIKAREEGKFAIIRYDKLIIRENQNNLKDNRNSKKRPLGELNSPNSDNSNPGIHDNRSSLNDNTNKNTINKGKKIKINDGKITTFFQNKSESLGDLRRLDERKDK